MTYSTSLAERVRQHLRGHRGVAEKKMFGGVGFLLRGNMLVGIWKSSLIVRLDRELAEQSITEPHVRPFDITGKPMKGWLMVEPDGLENDRQLAMWLDRAFQFVQTLPAK